MLKLLQRPNLSAPDGKIHSITPETANWSYVGFDVYKIEAGETVSHETLGNEVCLVLISGSATVRAESVDFGIIGARNSPFDSLPWSVYVPAKSSWHLQALTTLEFTVCKAPATGKLPPRLIPPSDVVEETRGKGTNTRHVRNILPDSSPHAETLLVVEVITPGGNWSSYPPHKHDTDAFPKETYLEETYYHRLNPPQGFGFQRVYTDDRAIDETMAISDRDVVLVPRGYHPVSAPHGFDLYYLNVMAGPIKSWKFSMAPEHAFLGW